MIPGTIIMNFQYSNMKQKSINALKRKKLSRRTIYLIKRLDNDMSEE